MVADAARHIPLEPESLPAVMGLPAPSGSTWNEALAGVTGRWWPATIEERDAYVRHVLDLCRDPGLRRDESANKAAWDRGWAEALREAEAADFAPDALTPRYFRGAPWLRWQGDVLATDNPHLEPQLLNVARLVLFEHFVRGARHIWELGCGSGQNLAALARLYPDAQVTGFDWAQPAVDIATRFGQRQGARVSGVRFDMLRPGPRRCADGTVVVTVHALEQLGTRHGPLLDWLLASRPALVLHYEPIAEFYDTGRLFDYLAAWYSTHRDYLTGYLPALREREARGQLEIVFARRPGLGGIVHEASVVAWRPR
jgi:S-adenosylmethionine-diacylgycerolhomoserine-N-methlytransferase